MKDVISHNAFIFAFLNLVFSILWKNSYCLKHLCSYGTNRPTLNTLCLSNAKATHHEALPLKLKSKRLCQIKQDWYFFLIIRKED